MTAPAPSIDQLKELALPVPASYMPQTWGWAVLAALLLLALLVWSVRRYRRWQLNRYRREALTQLARLEQALALEPERLNALRELPELLKRVALSMPDQTNVAHLSGDAWHEFLAAHSDTPLPADFGQQLAGLAYAPDSSLRNLNARQRAQLIGQCKRWVERHHVAA